ncbi:MAG: NfeD family protein [Betaproteobacteria bacterium]|jgi:membrane protein implicated in regulation of membrane protease activity|nr:NfeD family protein [Betaproteobacteria bacterium]
MEPHLLWIIAGFVLVIAELVTGTFYLLVIGVGAFAGAAVAWAGGAYLAQAVGGCAVALAGTWLVNRWHRSHRRSNPKDDFLDLGQPVVLETWTDADAGLARVKYRGTTWDARIGAGTRPDPGATLFINGQDGSTLLVSAAKPSN